MVNPKTPNKKRKSVGNVEGQPPTGQSPKIAKFGSPVKTPGKAKGKATPGKPNKTPQAGNAAKTPKQTPFKNQTQASGKKNKQVSESGPEHSPPKKMKMFAGLFADLEASPSKKKPQNKGNDQEKKQKQQETAPDAKKEKKKSKRKFFPTLKEQVTGPNKEEALKKLEEKIKAFTDRPELTKSAKRKLKLLQKLKMIATGEKVTTNPPSVAKERRERLKKAKTRKQTDAPQPQKTVTPAQTILQKDDDDESDESDYEVEAEIKPNKIIKTKDDDEEESGEEEEEEDESGDEEEEESGDEEGEESGDEEGEESGEEEDESEDEDDEAPKINQIKNQGKQSNPSSSKEKKSRYIVFAGNLPYDSTKQEISEHFTKAGQIRHIRIPTEKKSNKPRGFAYVEFNDEVSYQKALSMHHTFLKGRRINVLYTQGGKKKGEQKKNEVKAKNLKLQAMRKQGQLAGSVKETQKRSARRAKKNAKAVNGSD